VAAPERLRGVKSVRELEAERGGERAAEESPLPIDPTQIERLRPS